MIAGHYEYERQPGRPVVSSGSSYDLLLLICFILTCAILLSIFDIRQSFENRQRAQDTEQPSPDTDEETTIDSDLIIISDEDARAPGINGDVGQPRERLSQRGASPSRG